MKWNNSSFSEHYRKIRIEGFGLDKLLNKCIKDRIRIRGVAFINELELTLSISSRDLKKLKKLAKNTYRITVLGDGGYGYHIKRLGKKKITILGVLLFAALLFYQSLFIVEIRVNGYEAIGERDLRESLAEAGLYEGCRKDIDINEVKIHLYEEYDTISWVGIHFDGNLAEVSIAEGAKPVTPKVEEKTPCDIVADKAGYISRVIPTEGVRAVKDGEYVKKGDVLITGIVPLNNVAYGTDSEDETETYVHAAGTVEAKIPERIHFFAERYERRKEKTGKRIWGFSVNDYNLAKKRNHYEVSTVKTKNLLNIVKPFRLKIDMVCVEEVHVKEREVKNTELKKAVNAKIRQYAKENLPQKAQILNKSLNFSREKNIINIGVTLETLQTIGVEEEIAVDKRDGKDKKDNHQRGN